MEPNRMDYVVALLFLVFLGIFYASILVDALIRKRENASNNLILGTIAFMLFLVRATSNLNLLPDNGQFYLVLGLQLLATVAILLLKPDERKRGTPAWQRSLTISSIVMGTMSIIGLISAGFMVYTVFGSTMPSSALVILLANIPFLGAVIYKFNKLHEHNKTLL